MTDIYGYPKKCGFFSNAGLLSGDEVHFHLSGHINKQNVHHWVEINLRQLHKKPQHCHREQFGARFNILMFMPLSFLGGRPNAYCNFRSKCEEPKETEIGNPDMLFQQDGANAHAARRSVEVLWEPFQWRLISLRSDDQQPVRSSDPAYGHILFGAL